MNRDTFKGYSDKKFRLVFLEILKEIKKNAPREADSPHKSSSEDQYAVKGNSLDSFSEYEGKMVKDIKELSTLNKE